MADKQDLEEKKLQSGKLDQVVNAHRDAHFKFTHFFMTAAGAAIAFAINQTQTAVLSWSKIPLGVAVACWGLSFAAGTLHLLEL